MDLSWIMEVWHPEWLYQGRVTAVNPTIDIPWKNVSGIYVGTSFSDGIRALLGRAGYHGQDHLLPYYRSEAGNFDWDGELASRPIILIEQVGWSQFTENTVQFVNDLWERSARFRKIVAEFERNRMVTGK